MTTPRTTPSTARGAAKRERSTPIVRSPKAMAAEKAAAQPCMTDGRLTRRESTSTDTFVDRCLKPHGHAGDHEFSPAAESKAAAKQAASLAANTAPVAAVPLADDVPMPEGLEIFEVVFQRAVKIYGPRLGLTASEGKPPMREKIRLVLSGGFLWCRVESPTRGTQIELVPASNIGNLTAMRSRVANKRR